jgi:type II secretion system protein C
VVGLTVNGLSLLSPTMRTGGAASDVRSRASGAVPSSDARRYNGESRYDVYRRDGMAMTRPLWAANAALLVLAAFVVARAFSDAGRPEEPFVRVGRAATDVVRGTEAVPVGRDGCAMIAQRNVFAPIRDASATPTPRPHPVPPPAAPQPLRLKLCGVIAGDASVARALIEDMTAGGVDVYSVGAVVQGARIERIDRFRVYVSRDGRKEVLEMQVTPAVAAVGPPPRRVGRTVPQGPTPEQMERAVRGRPVPARPPDLPSAVVQGKVNLQQRMAHLDNLLQTSSFPYRGGDGRQGLQIRAGERGGGLGDVPGLRNHDVIVAINGQSCVSREQARTALAIALAHPPVTIGVLRGGKQETISFQ